MFFLFPRLERPAGWICARYKALLLLLSMYMYLVLRWYHLFTCVVCCDWLPPCVCGVWVACSLRRVSRLCQICDHQTLHWFIDHVIDWQKAKIIAPEKHWYTIVSERLLRSINMTLSLRTSAISSAAYGIQSYHPSTLTPHSLQHASMSRQLTHNAMVAANHNIRHSSDSIWHFPFNI